MWYKFIQFPEVLCISVSDSDGKNKQINKYEMCEIYV